MKIEIGDDFTLLLTDRGEVYSWGENNFGQLGIGIIDKDYHKPTKIKFSFGVPIRYISAGDCHAVAIDFDYNVYMWDITIYIIIVCYYNILTMKIEIGDDFTLLLTDRGDVYSWGYNHYGQLGISTTDDDYHKPTKIKFSLGVPIRYISVGNSQAAAIDFDYNVYIWGYNNHGQLGLGDKVDRCSPTIIEYLTDKKIEKVYCMRNATITLTQNGEVYFWGLNYNGRLGNNNIVDTPTKQNFPNNTLIKKIYVGYYHAYAIDTCSKMYSWCSNYNYQSCIEDFNINKIVCLNRCTIILADNKLYSIGRDNYGGLGLGIVETNKLTLIKEGVDNVWGNDSTVFCKMINGDIYVWGFNNYGQLGIGNTINQYVPVKLNMTVDIKSINYYEGVTYAITTSEDIYTWGKNKLVNKKSMMEPILFTYFLDNDIDVKYTNRTKSARKIDYYNIYYDNKLLL